MTFARWHGAGSDAVYIGIIWADLDESSGSMAEWKFVQDLEGSLQTDSIPDADHSSAIERTTARGDTFTIADAKGNHADSGSFPTMTRYDERLCTPPVGTSHRIIRQLIRETTLMAEANAQPVQTATAPLRTVATAVATAAEAVRDGASDALAKARQAVPVTGESISHFVYSSFYYLSYGVVFPTLLVTNFIPGCGPIANGLVDGAAAANDVILDMKDKAAARKAAQTEPQTAPAQP